MKRHDPNRYCPICGELLGCGHRCKPAVIHGIDGAETRARRADDGEYGERRKPYGQRMQDGFDLLDSDEAD